jgi:heme-degrading monooxygenase HmoA
VTEPWTHGRWRVKPGREQEFVEAWRELAEWSLKEFPEARGAKLLRDRDQPNRFYSFGVWDSDEAVARWRAHSGFSEAIERMSELIEELEPITADGIETLGEFG